MNILVAGIAIVVIAGASVVAWRVGGPRDRPFDPSSPIRIVLLVYLLMYGLGSVWIAASGEAVAGPLAAAGGFVALAAGAWVGVRVFGPAHVIASGMVEGVIRPIPMGLLAVVGLAGYLWLATRYGIPLLSDDPLATRSSFGGIPFDLFRWFVPPAVLVAFGVAVVRRSGRAWAIAAALMAVVIGLEIIAASRALPLELGLAAVLMILWAGLRIKLRVWTILGVATAVLFLAVLFARMGSGLSFADPGSAAAFAANRTVGRVVLIHPRTIDVVVRTFPAEQAFFGGGTYVRWLAPLSGGERQESLGSILFRKLFPNEPPGGFAAPGILGEAWANAGPILAGLLVAGIGFAAAALSRLGALLRPTVVDRTFLAVLSVALARSYASSLNGLILTAAVSTFWWLVCSGRLERIGVLTLRRIAGPGHARATPSAPAVDPAPPANR